MATTQNTYTGNGSTTNYSFTFEYLKQADVKVTLNTAATTAYTFANATTLAFTTAPATGVAIRIFRDTPSDTLSSTFFPGSAIKAEDLNENFTQNLYVTQESDAEAALATATANGAVTTANSAVTTANGAVTTANSANTKSDAAVATSNTAETNSNTAVATANTANTNSTNAVSTANTASTNATTAVNTANPATTTANGAVTTANSAATDAASAITTANSATTTANTALANAATATTTANGAVTTANSTIATAANAVTTANGAVTTANTADTNATAAVNTANAAAATVAATAFYAPIAALANLPGSPSNEDRVEVVNSTGVESNSSVSGVPAGFVGSTDLTVRLQYNSSTSKWVWQQYFAADPENRYLTESLPVVKGDSTNGSGQITLNCDNNSHGVTIKGPQHSAGATYTLKLPDTVGAANNLLQVDGAGNLSWKGSDYLSSGNSIINTGNTGITLSAVNSGTVLNLTGTGASITTPLTLSGNPTAANHAANKAYVDSSATIITQNDFAYAPSSNTATLPTYLNAVAVSGTLSSGEYYPTDAAGTSYAVLHFSPNDTQVKDALNTLSVGDNVTLAYTTTYGNDPSYHTSLNTTITQLPTANSSSYNNLEVKFGTVWSISKPTSNAVVISSAQMSNGTEVLTNNQVLKYKTATSKWTPEDSGSIITQTDFAYAPSSNSLTFDDGLTSTPGPNDSEFSFFTDANTGNFSFKPTNASIKSNMEALQVGDSVTLDWTHSNGTTASQTTTVNTITAQPIPSGSYGTVVFANAGLYHSSSAASVTLTCSRFSNGVEPLANNQVLRYKTATQKWTVDNIPAAGVSLGLAIALG